MRLKPLPPPPESLDDVWRARQAIPLVPGTEMDCCARVIDRLELDTRPVAREWLTLLRAVNLVTVTDGGYARTRQDVDREDLAAAFVENVYGAREVLDSLGANPKRPPAIFDQIRDIVPAWERDKYRGTWQEVWRDRTTHLLGWFDLLGLAEQCEEGYIRTESVLSERTGN